MSVKGSFQLNQEEGEGRTWCVSEGRGITPRGESLRKWYACAYSVCRHQRENPHRSEGRVKKRLAMGEGGRKSREAQGGVFCVLCGKKTVD